MLKSGYVPFGPYQTYYRIAGAEYLAQKVPLVLLHGGPGSTHNYFEVLDDLAQADQRALVMYDQLGCGQSSMPDKTPDVYNQQNWLAELVNLRQALGLKEIHLLGQSFGGVLTLMYMLTKPKGVKSIILASTLSSAKLWADELHRLIKFMPEAEQEAILTAEKQHDFQNPAYVAANEHFMRLHSADMTRPSLPKAVTRPKKTGTVAYLTGWGPNEYNPEGNLSGYEVTSRLAEITTPALITSGTDDLCTPLVAKTMYDHLPKARWKLFAGCRHMSFVQEHDAYVTLLKEWLNQND